MTTNFPISLDTFVNPTSANNLSDTTVLHSTQHANINDCMAAVEAKVGINSSTVSTTLDYLIKSASSVNPGHLHVPRVVVMTDSSSFTPTAGTADINTQVNTQTSGTLVANAPSGSPVNGQFLELVIKSTNVQTFSWNGIYTGCLTTVLPTSSTGSGKTDKFFFQYNSLSTHWEIFNAQYGY